MDNKNDLIGITQNRTNNETNAIHPDLNDWISTSMATELETNY